VIVAVYACVSEKVTLATSGRTETELSNGMMVRTVGELCMVIPPRVPLTKSDSVPVDGYAVNVTVLPDVALREPRLVLVSDHEYVAPEVQFPSEHIGLTENIWVPLGAMLADAGETTTSRSAFPRVIIAGLLWTVLPLSVALTNSAIVPEILPAVKATAGPEVVLRVPSARVIVQEYV
jgi:hypothetical protein